MKNMVVYGAGGHGKVVAEILAAMGHTVRGFIDDDVELCGKTILGLRVFEAGEWLKANSGSQIALGIGDNYAREKAACSVREYGCALLPALHPAATVSKSAMLRDGVVVMAGAVLNAECRIEPGAIINTGAIVEHDVRISCYAHISPNATLGGGSQIGTHSHIGMSASVLPLKIVGADCIVGAGAVVIDDIPDGQIAYGIPARVQSKR